MNVSKARPAAIEKNNLFQALKSALGIRPNESLENFRYERIVLLFDPDADGIHCGALMLIYFHRQFPALIESGKLCVVHAPLCEFLVEAKQPKKIYAYAIEQISRLANELRQEGFEFQQQRFRGLASLGETTLKETCVCPETRTLHRLTIDDALSATSIFGGKK